MDGLTEYCLQSIAKDCSSEDLLKAYLEYESKKSSSSVMLSNDLEKALLNQMRVNFKSICESDLFHQLEKNQIILLVQKLASHFES